MSAVQDVPYEPLDPDAFDRAAKLLSSPDKDVTQVAPHLGRNQLLTSIWFAVSLIEEISKTKYTGSDTCAWVTELAPLRKLTPYSLQLLWHKEVSEVTADCLGDILNPFSAFFTPQDLDMLVHFLVSEQARDQLSLLLEGIFDPEPMAIARLLLAYGDASIQDLAKNLNNPKVQPVMRELMQLLQCEGYAGAADEICTPALEFWQSYTEFLIDSLYGDEAKEAQWIDDAKEYVIQAIANCWVKVRLPPEETWAGWNQDEKGDFKAFRADVKDLLQSSYTLLGTSVFDRLAQLALEALQNHAWLHLEATLFCLNALGETISDEDVVDASLSRLYSSALFPRMMDASLAIPSKTQQTAMTTTVSFAAFVERHTEFLPSMLTFLFESLKVPKLARVAAKAIYSTCDTCRKSLVSEVDAFLRQYEALLRWDGVEAMTKERVIGAIAAIVQAIPSTEHQVVNFIKLLDYVERDVEACLESAKVGLMEQSQEYGICALRCLVEMGKSMQEADGTVIDLENEALTEDAHHSSTWAASQERIVHCLHAVSASLSTDGEIIEACCQLLRTGYKEFSPGPFVFSPKITESFVANSNLHTPRLENVLDTAGAMLTRHTRTAAKTVDTSLITFLVHVFQLAAAMGYNPSTEPGVSASCIDLAAKYIPHYLHIFLHPQCQQHIANFITFTIRCLAGHEIMPIRASAFFWALLFQQKYGFPPEVGAMVDSILAQYGPHATLIIVHKISGQCARSEVETYAEPLKRLAFTQVRAKQWLEDAFYTDSFPSQKMASNQKRLFLEKVIRPSSIASTLENVLTATPAPTPSTLPRLNCRMIVRALALCVDFVRMEEAAAGEDEEDEEGRYCCVMVPSDEEEVSQRMGGRCVWRR
ncbi:MAG: hypothetical protein Q9185_001702 [Variospora sp. 1 TL-2023]